MIRVDASKNEYTILISSPNAFQKIHFWIPKRSNRHKKEFHHWLTTEVVHRVMAAKEEVSSSSSSSSSLSCVPAEDINTTTTTTSGGDDVVVVGGGTIAEMTSPITTTTSTTTTITTTEDEPFVFLLLEALPPELLGRILTQYLDGKSLSTLTLVSACCTSNSFYQDLAYCKMSKIAVGLFSQLGKDMDEKPPPGKYEFLEDGITIKRRHYAAYTQWILDKVVHPSNSSTKRLKQHHHENTLLMHQIRMVSTILAAMDYLRGGTKNDFSTTDHWEWPIFIGQISIQWKDDSTGDNVDISPMVQILSPMIYEDDRPEYQYFFDFSLISQHRDENLDTAPHKFCLQPRVFGPFPAWGRMKGLRPEDDECLQKLAHQLDTTDRNVAVPNLECDRNHYICITTKQHMKNHLASSIFPRQREIPSLEWVLEEVDSDDDNDNDIHPLMCHWSLAFQYDEHNHVNDAIRSLKLRDARDAFLKSATTSTTSS